MTTSQIRKRMFFLLRVLREGWSRGCLVWLGFLIGNGEPIIRDPLPLQEWK